MVKAKTPAQMEIEKADIPAAPSMLVELAVNKGASVEVIEKLLGLQERYDANQARKAFSQAISDVRADLPAINKDRTVDFTSTRGRTHYKYEDLSGVVDALAPVLSKHGLSFRWRTRSDATNVYVTCILSHAQGYSEETELCCRHDDTGNKNPIQAIGSAVTYLQRYTLKAAIGIAASDDDDGQSAAPRPDEVGNHHNSREDLITVKPKGEKTITVGQLGLAIMDYVNNDKDQAREILIDIAGRKVLNGMTPAEIRAAWEDLNNRYLNRQPGDDSDNIPEQWPEMPPTEVVK